MPPRLRLPRNFGGRDYVSVPNLVSHVSCRLVRHSFSLGWLISRLIWSAPICHRVSASSPLLADTAPTSNDFVAHSLRVAALSSDLPRFYRISSSTSASTRHSLDPVFKVAHHVAAMAIDKIVTEPSLVAVLQISDQARDQAESLVKVVEELGDGTLSAEEQADVAKQQKLLFTNISHLRGLHRNACFSARETKTETAEARQEVDRLHLQLQNLFYEQRHLQGEISACESYDHKYQQLPLIPLEAFLTQHPEHANDDENTLMVARIDHERAEREALEQQRQELLKRKQKLIADNKRRKDDLASLDNDLEKFIDAAKPIQKLFEKAP